MCKRQINHNHEKGKEARKIKHVLFAVAQSRTLPYVSHLMKYMMSQGVSHVMSHMSHTGQSDRSITPANLGAIGSYQLHKHTRNCSGEKKEQNQKQKQEKMFVSWMIIIGDLSCARSLLINT